MLVYKNIYNRLNKLGVIKLIEHKEAARSQVSGLMDLNFDLLVNNGEKARIALSQHSEQNHDLMADPDMEIRIFKDNHTAEALTYQNDFVGRFDRVYPQINGKVYVKPKLKRELNRFLLSWLNTLLSQGHKFN